MNCTLFVPGKCVPLLTNLSGGSHEASRISVRLRTATGTYILQCNRAIYNQIECGATCNLCGDADETLIHFLLECNALKPCRQPTMTVIEVKSMQRSEPETITPQLQSSKPKRKITNITNSQNTKITYGQPSEQLFPKRWPLS